MKENSKTKRGDCERAAEHYIREIHHCTITRRAVRTQFQSVDFFASDVVGKRQDGTHVYVQATAGQAEAVRQRRRKLEEVPWHPSDVVELVQLVQTPNPANARQKHWFFRIHKYQLHRLTNDGLVTQRNWVTLETAVPVPKEWFKPFKEKKDGGK